jgi:acyl-[acyl carrier protein]--UDP-N-acetylglucosamine O-acyltransferase
MYKLLYLSALSLEEAKKEIQALVPSEAEIQIVLNFLERSSRGICR